MAEKCIHPWTTGREDQHGTWCGDCGEKIYEVETRQCAACKHVKHLHTGWICSKHLVVVVPCLYVTYKISQGSCFEEASNG